MLPLAQSIARVFARLGEKKNRSRARLKFLVQDLGIEKFKKLVLEERKSLPDDPRWTEMIADAENAQETPLRPGGKAPLLGTEAFQRWVKTNTRPQKQEGYTVVTIALPLGDLTSTQLRALADIARRFTKETIRSTVEQNIVLRWVSQSDLIELHKALEAAGLGNPGAGSIVDVAACPGTDTCKLGISSSRGLAAELRKRLDEKNVQLDDSVAKLHIKISGCFNSCGQHHVADLGFYGVSRKVSGYAVPHFQVVLGGQWENNGASYGLPVIAIPSKNIPEVVSRLTDRYAASRTEGESFKDFVERTGKVQLKKMLEDLARPPADLSDRSFFQDWGDPREYTLADMGVGECAGEVISSVDFDLGAAERELFEAQVALEGGEIEKAGQTAYQSMLRAAKGLVKIESFQHRGRSGADRRGISRALLRHAEILRSVCRRKIRPLPFYRLREIRRTLHAGLDALPDRRSATFYRRRAQLLQSHFRAGDARLSDGCGLCPPDVAPTFRLALCGAERCPPEGGRYMTLTKELQRMQLQHVNVKLLVQNPEETNLEPLIPVFHSWIENQEGDELLIDVADYTHVPAGPGIVLIGHEGNYSLDNAGNRLGVRYNRKAAFDGGNQECLAQATLAALTACQRLESEPRLGGLFRFNGQDIEFFINDRLIAPNDAATREAFDRGFSPLFPKTI